jgi:hypothetical protein
VLLLADLVKLFLRSRHGDRASVMPQYNKRRENQYTLSASSLIRFIKLVREYPISHSVCANECEDESCTATTSLVRPSH